MNHLEQTILELLEINRLGLSYYQIVNWVRGRLTFMMYDTKQISNAINKLYNEGLMRGDADNFFISSKGLSRAEKLTKILDDILNL